MKNTHVVWPPYPWTVVVNGAGKKRAFNRHTDAVGPWRETYAEAQADIEHSMFASELLREFA